MGYTVTNTTSVKIRDFDKIGLILAGVVEKGANEVSSLRFPIDDPEVPRAEARAEAIAKAREKAKDVAKEAGFGLGRILSVNEGGVSPVYFGGGFADVAVEARALSAPSIEPGSEDVSVTVTLTYEIR